MHETSEKPDNPSDRPRVTSPASTGGAGTFFEQHVDTYWLAQLLVSGIPPILHDSTITEVHLQTEHLGWHTDDFLIVAKNGGGRSRKLAGQVRRSFTVSASDDECKKVIQDFWKDFKNSEQFSATTDRFALITLRGTNTLLEHFSGLLDCSRAARDAAEFESRLTTPGFLSAKSVEYCNNIQEIISESEGKTVSNADIWPFLRVLHVLSLDLNTSTRQAEVAIKNLLAYTTGQPDKIGVAEASWNKLLTVVGEGMPRAVSFQRDNLPAELRRLHSPVVIDQRPLQALTEHSALILDGIRTTIGNDLHLHRSQLVQQVIDKLETTQVVLVSGAAGNGKSSLAKDIISFFLADHFTFSFRAEEFACPHFDETLQRNQIPLTASMLSAVLSGQGRKIMLVESVERLLEASTRDAFTDLLTLVKGDRSWRVILTCRDYSVDLVRTCFLEFAGIEHAVIAVLPLKDEELQEVEKAYPTLARPLANARLRGLLRNPYVLDKALQIHWSDDRPLPQSERDFRALFWQDIVCDEYHAAGGMPRRRHEVFVQIALRRAMALTLYASCSDLDAAVVDVLRRDSLIVSSQNNRILVAPAHDVLEDWAILHWIEEQYASYDGSVRELSSALGTYPAVRRTYRKWVSELVERDPGAADCLFQAVIHESGLSRQFQDDTLVSILRSSVSAEFLEKHSAELFANGAQLLRRAIHLLRVACVTTPTWLAPNTAKGSLFNVPDGPAWACVLRLVQNHFEAFAEEDRSLLLGLLEDWVRGVSWQTPYPEGATSVAAIAHRLLPSFNHYRSEGQRKRTLRVIAKIPNADRDRFADLLEGNQEDDRRDHMTEDFLEIIFEGMEGMPAARDVPELIISAATRYLLCSDEDLQHERRYSSSLELEPLFGIKEGRSHDFFPPSAYRGPFLHLMRHHPRQGLDFIIAVFNYSADWYAHPRVQLEHVEEPFQITLTFADGTSRSQWCNSRLWNLYRGSSVGPYVLQSLLMALERWLFEYAEVHPRDLSKILIKILRRSDSTALTAVVSSVATAFPHAAGEALLVLLSSKRCILLDRQRLVKEAQVPSRFGLSFDPKNKAYDEERRESDSLPHRRSDLETAIINLQLGPLAPRAHEILDRHRADMLPIEQQNDSDRIWRLAIHRMDLRQYTMATDSSQTETSVDSDGRTSPEDGRVRFRLEPNDPEPDIKEMVEKNQVDYQTMSSKMNLFMWGVKVFGNEESATYDPAQWRERLREILSDSSGHDGNNIFDMSRGGPGFVAAICVRDHWEEMSDTERDRCVDIVCSEIERQGDMWNHLLRMPVNSMSADRACSWVIPLLLRKSLREALQTRVRQTFAVALTHAIDEVRFYASLGIGQYLWRIDRNLALRCVNAVATEATMVQRAVDSAMSRPSENRWHFDDIEAETATFIRTRLFEDGAIANDAYRTMDPNKWYGSKANERILVMLGQATNEPFAIRSFEQVAHLLVRWWDEDEDRLRKLNQQRQQRNDKTESTLTKLLENFLLLNTAESATTIISPIVDAIDRHPDKVYWFLIGLIGAEDRRPNTAQFWSLWNLFAEKVRSASWISDINDKYCAGAEMIKGIFLGTWWKENVRHWRSLERHDHHVHKLFEELPPSSRVLDAYVMFLYHIGEQSLPHAFIRIAKRLQQGNLRPMMKNENTIFRLEVLLQRYVYGRPLELKRQSELREAILFLLDQLVENGSSAAFRMRDDFVTPVSLT